HGFLLSEGRYTTIDVPGSTLTELLGINDAGQIVGQYYESSGNAHAFLATPVPEPANILMLAIGIVGLISFLQCRNGPIHSRSCAPEAPPCSERSFRTRLVYCGAVSA